MTVTDSTMSGLLVDVDIAWDESPQPPSEQPLPSTSLTRTTLNPPPHLLRPATEAGPATAAPELLPEPLSGLPEQSPTPRKPPTPRPAPPVFVAPDLPQAPARDHGSDPAGVTPEHSGATCGRPQPRPAPRQQFRAPVLPTAPASQDSDDDFDDEHDPGYTDSGSAPQTSDPTTVSTDLALPPPRHPAPAEPRPVFRRDYDGLTDPAQIRSLVKPPPKDGWRAALYRHSNGLFNPGISPEERALAELGARASRPLNPRLGAHKLSVVSLKGGVGKTTVAAMLGLTLADVRTDRVAAVDANPDSGTLHDRLVGHTQPKATLQNLLDDLAVDLRLSDMAIKTMDNYTVKARRLSVLAGAPDPLSGASLLDSDYDDLMAAMTRFFNIVIADCGTGLAHPIMRAALEHTDSLIVVATPSLDAANLAADTLDWLVQTDYGDLVDNAVAVLSNDNTTRDVDREALHTHLSSRCRAVIEIPTDPHLASGGLIDFDSLAPRTRRAYLELAATLGDQF